MYDLIGIAKNTKQASITLLSVKEKKINDILKTLIELLNKNLADIKKANIIDIDNAKKNGKSEAMIDRLVINEQVMKGITDGLENVISLKSPVGKTIYKYDNTYQDIKIKAKVVPFGVVGMIYEARPNVTVDAFALTLKTKNAVILKGGSDAINTNIAIVKVIKQALKENGLNENIVSLIEDTSRETAIKFMKLKGYIDLLIPRGSANLIKSALENATVPVIETGAGNCHIYVDKFADIKKATEIIFNAKTQRYGVCNACESLVIHKDILEKALPEIEKKLKEKNVELRCDKEAIKFTQNGVKATQEDFYAEYLGAIISVKTVNSLAEAIKHINEHSTHHSESIITESKRNAKIFMTKIDSSAVYQNASTRFTDGFVFGFGAEIGISTQKLHSRGPMGLDALTTRKYYVVGNSSIRK